MAQVNSDNEMDVDANPVVEIELISSAINAPILSFPNLNNYVADLEEPVTIRQPVEIHEGPERRVELSDFSTQTDFVEEPRRKRTHSDSDEDDGRVCPICYDYWTNSGDHRLCALRCGHLFGHKCLVRWLAEQKMCPTCKATVRKPDIRFVYAKKLIAVDTTELEAMREKLEQEKVAKTNLELELNKVKQREAVQHHTIFQLTAQIKNANFSLTQKKITGFNIYKDRTYSLNKDGGCRVMDYYKNLHVIVASAPSQNALFAGYGVRKLPIDTMRSSFIPLHASVIRDLSFHYQNNLLLSASMDGMAKITEITNNRCVMHVDTREPVWSCCWDAMNMFYFYTGGQRGSVAKYDTRQLKEKVSAMSFPNDMSPVISLSCHGWSPGGFCPNGGIFVCKLSSGWVFENVPNATTDLPTETRYPLAIDPPFVSMRYDDESKHLLVSSRPNSQNANAHHTLYALQRSVQDETTIICNPVHKFQGTPIQKLLSRSCQFKMGDEHFVAAHEEQKKVVNIWSVNSGAKVKSVSAFTPVLDLCPIITDTEKYLCALTESKIDFFKMDI